jgi:hypothetical protein
VCIIIIQACCVCYTSLDFNVMRAGEIELGSRAAPRVNYKKALKKGGAENKN